MSRAGRVPRDPDDPRYAQSFSLDTDEPVAIRSFLAEHGFVVVRDVLTPEECAATRDEMWQHLECEGKLDRHRPTTWDEWPSSSKPKYGMVAHVPVFTPCALHNRQNPRLIRAHAILLGTDDLLCSQDRLGLMMPTRLIKTTAADGSTSVLEHVPRWKTSDSLHLDMDPFRFHEQDKQPVAIRNKLEALRYADLGDFVTENNIPIHSSINGGLHLQTIINLHDNQDEDGGLQLVPRFHIQFDQWTETLKQGCKDLHHSEDDAGALSIYPIPAALAAKLQPQRVPSREGSTVIWDARVAHGSRSNNSSQGRYVQFIKVFPRSNLPSGQASKNRSKSIAKQVRLAERQGFQLTDIGRQVFGL